MTRTTPPVRISTLPFPVSVILIWLLRWLNTQRTTSSSRPAPQSSHRQTSSRRWHYSCYSKLESKNSKAILQTAASKFQISKFLDDITDRMLVFKILSVSSAMIIVVFRTKRHELPNGTEIYPGLTVIFRTNHQILPDGTEFKSILVSFFRTILQLSLDGTEF